MTSPPPRLPHAASAEAILAGLAQHRVVLIEGFPLDDPARALVDWATRLGRLSRHGIGVNSATEADYVHVVRPLAAPTRDRFGNVVRSTTRVAMACHTDDYFSTDPIDTMALLCCRGDPAVATLTAVLDRALALLSPDMMAELAQPNYPTPFGYVPLLAQDEGQWTIRYDDYELGKMAAAGKPFSARGKAASRALAKALAKVAEPIVLAEGQCLLIDNRRVLHGRSEIPDDSLRELRRVRFHRHRAPALEAGM